MEREQSYMTILDAMAKIQFNVSLILEAKAAEAEKSRNWVCGQIHSASFEAHEDGVKHSLDFHEQLIEVIDGITKMENSLARNMKLVLGHENEDSSSGGGFGNFMEFGADSDNDD
ncbi:restriction endonuclease subunit S [Paenibacillus turpanensis]|uniref:restriction endonuclease subunit S n=1 Tax=Paenibacillus turpanensis TaxID=2689078 RepID=UPI00140A7F9E|nr:restriction endonuclease subunit S [Paenibacillus turpanensis]